eukprot:4848404-Pleurochrysis_carterae.AAC.1
MACALWTPGSRQTTPGLLRCAPPPSPPAPSLALLPAVAGRRPPPSPTGPPRPTDPARPGPVRPPGPAPPPWLRWSPGWRAAPARLAWPPRPPPGASRATRPRSPHRGLRVLRRLRPRALRSAGFPPPSSPAARPLLPLSPPCATAGSPTGGERPERRPSPAAGLPRRRLRQRA